MAKAKTKYSNPELNSIHGKIEDCIEKIKLLKKEISETKQVFQELKALSAKASEIEASYRKSNISQMLKLNLGYKADKEKIHLLKSKLGHNKLEHLVKQLADETTNLGRLNENFEQTEIKVKKLLELKRLEDKLIKKPKRKKVGPTVKSERVNLSKKKQKVVARVERFKSSSGGSSTALTSRSSTWTVKKR